MSGRNGHARKTKVDKRECWYYDACTLSSETILKEIINKRIPHRSIVSHLAVGEAVANEYQKGIESGQYFIELFEKLIEYIEFVQHDDVSSFYEEIKEEFSTLSLSDALHLATAIKHRCKILKSADGDICNEPRAGQIKSFVKSRYTFDLKVSRVSI